MIKRIRRWFERRRKRKMAMQHQKLTDITRGLQAAAAETNALVADQFIRILSEYFERHEDGTLEAKMVRVQLDDKHYSLVPLVSLVAPAGLALDRMRVQLSIRLEDAEEERTGLLQRLNLDGKHEEEAVSRSQFKVSLSPRSKGKGKGRPSDHVNIDLQFKALETPESILRVIDTYTNMIAPIPIPIDSKALPPEPEPGPEAGPESGSEVEPESNTEPGDEPATDDKSGPGTEPDPDGTET
jgi:hypothetical protein